MRNAKCSASPLDMISKNKITIIDNMKNTIAIFAILAASAAMAEMKIGTVDMMILVKNHPSYETNKNLLQSTERDYQKRLDQMKSELDSIQDEGRKLADEYRNPMLAQAAKTKIENDLGEIQKRFMEKQQFLRNEAMRNQQDLADLEARLLKAQAEDIKKRVDVFAKKTGWDMILDSTATIFAKDVYDVTDAVLKDMGIDPKVAKDKAEDESK